jgi:hypothetical protein
LPLNNPGCIIILGSQHGRFYSDNFFSDSKSIRGNTMAQLFVNDASFLKIFPMEKKSEATTDLLDLIHNIGIPYSLHTDGTKELQYGTWCNVCQEYNIK